MRSIDLRPSMAKRDRACWSARCRPTSAAKRARLQARPARPAEKDPPRQVMPARIGRVRVTIKWPARLWRQPRRRAESRRWRRGGLTTSTGQCARRSTVSATLPINSRARTGASVAAHHDHLDVGIVGGFQNLLGRDADQQFVHERNDSSSGLTGRTATAQFGVLVDRHRKIELAANVLANRLLHVHQKRAAGAMRCTGNRGRPGDDRGSDRREIDGYDNFCGRCRGTRFRTATD